MKNRDKNIHRGKILHDAAKHHPKKIKDIVEAAGYKYGTFYKHKNDPYLSFEIIAKYGRVMDKDFSVEFPEMANLPSLLIIEPSNGSKSNEQLRNEIRGLSEKYATLLHKHNLVLETNIALREENIELKEDLARLKLKVK